MSFDQSTNNNNHYDILSFKILSLVKDWDTTWTTRDPFFHLVIPPPPSLTPTSSSSALSSTAHPPSVGEAAPSPSHGPPSVHPLPSIAEMFYRWRTSSPTILNPNVGVSPPTLICRPVMLLSLPHAACPSPRSAPDSSLSQPLAVAPTPSPPAPSPSHPTLNPISTVASFWPYPVTRSPYSMSRRAVHLSIYG
jgi:hypothetical protein